MKTTLELANKAADFADFESDMLPFLDRFRKLCVADFVREHTKTLLEMADELEKEL